MKAILPAAFFPRFQIRSPKGKPTGRKRSSHMNQLIQPKNFTTLIVSAAALVCFGLCQMAPAVLPAPDGGYPGFNTAEGDQALQNLTTGIWNTAIGNQALFSDTTGRINTATGI